jgi:DNA-binding FadR family transcriptional regulator
VTSAEFLRGADAVPGNACTRPLSRTERCSVTVGIRVQGVRTERINLKEVNRAPLANQVRDQLRDVIAESIRMDLLFPPELELSKQLNVSRPTIREAMRYLEAEGLLTRHPRTSGVRVDATPVALSRPLSEGFMMLSRAERISLADVVDLRITIEERAAELSAEVAEPRDLEVLERAVAEWSHTKGHGRPGDGTRRCVQIPGSPLAALSHVNWSDLRTRGSTNTDQNDRIGREAREKHDHRR